MGDRAFEPVWTQNEPAPQPRDARRPRRAVLAGVSVAAVAAVVAAAVALGSGHAAKSAQTIVADSVSSALANKTAQATLTMHMLVGSRPLTASGAGGVDFSAGAMRFGLNMSFAGQQVPLTIEYLGGKVYEQIPGLDQLLPGKSWVSLDFSSAVKAGGQGTGVLGANNPAAMLRLLVNQGNTVTSDGSSTVDGVAVHGYHVLYSPAIVNNPKVIAALPSWMQSAIKGINIAGSNSDVYIDHSGHLVRFTMHMTIQGPTDVHMDESMDLSGYGTPVTVTAPDPSQVASFQQLLQAAQAQSSGA